MEKLISVVLPVYNGEKFLRESIDSVINQTYQNWELLILDDCSTDSTSEIAEEYVLKDSRIKYYKNEHNLRLPRNLNKGFALSQGEYLTWTSDDNMYKPEALQKMAAALDSDADAQFVFASCRIINEKGEEIEYISVYKSSPRYIVGQDTVGACFMYTRKVYEEIGEYDPEYTLVEDFDYWQRICMKFKAITISEILYKCRWHDGALTSTMSKDEFNSTLEKMLLKNRSGFGKLDFKQNYYYYRGLYNCRKNMGEKNNPYRIKYRYYSALMFLGVRVPNKLKRMLKK